MKTGWQKWVKFCSFTAATFLAAVMILLRFQTLHEPFIYDEVYSWVTANPMYPFGTVWKEVLLRDVNLPLFNIVLRAWAYVTPHTTAWLRAFPLLFSLGVIPAVWWAAPKSWERSQKAVLALLFASSFACVQYGNVVRGYSLGVLLTAVCTLLALRLIESMAQPQTVGWKTWLAFWGLGLCSAYTHYFSAGIFFITCLFLFFAACGYRKYRARVFWSTALLFVLWIPWVFFTMQPMESAGGEWWFHTSKILASWQIIEFNLGAPWLSLSILIFIIIGIISLLYTGRPLLKKHMPAVLAGFQIGVFIIVVWGVSFRHNLFMDRYFLMLLPSVYLLLTEVLIHLTHRWAGWWVALAVLVGGSTWQHITNYIPRTQDSSGLVQTFNYVADLGYDKVLLLYDQMTYPGPAAQWVLAYYLPKDKPLQLIALTPQNSVWMEPPHSLLLVAPLGNFPYLMRSSGKYNFFAGSKRTVFEQTAVLQHPNAVLPVAPQK